MLKAAISQAILRMMPVRASGYTDSLLTKYRVEREASCSRSPPPFLLAKAVRDTNAHHVVDFGGGAGEIARNLVAVFPSVQVSIVENEAMVKSGRRSAGVTFANELPAQCDVFFTSGALFFVSNPFDILERGFKTAKAVVMTRNYFGKSRTVTQRSWLWENGHGPHPPGFPKWVAVAYKRTNMDEAAVLALAEKCGHTLVHQGAGLHGRDLVFHSTHTAVI